ncbi:pyrimidine 5-nucleotidase [Mycena floridula]|nr:pyrimidine 5-nucleotidase [Mycena floridula]
MERLVGDLTMSIDDRSIVWFDIDNTLYSASARVSQAMGQKIHDYFVKLGLDEEEASKLHLKYYTQYGLALAGLVKHHQIDPLEFDRNCDGALEIENMIFPNPAHRKLFQDLDRTKVRVWALTNAYRTHAERVLRILNLHDQIDGLVFCDYEEKDIVAKPDPAFYHKALKLANVSDPSKCLFVDDNRRNIDAAKALGWRCVHFCEAGLENVEGGKVKAIGTDRELGASDNDVPVISELEELRLTWSDIFKH